MMPLPCCDSAIFFAYRVSATRTAQNTDKQSLFQREPFLGREHGNLDRADRLVYAALRVWASAEKGRQDWLLPLAHETAGLFVKAPRIQTLEYVRWPGVTRSS